MRLDQPAPMQNNSSQQRSSRDQDRIDMAQNNIPHRHRLGKIWRIIFLASTIVGIVVLTLLIFNILNQSYGYVAVEFKVDPVTLAVNNIPLEQLTNDELIEILRNNLSQNRYKTLDREQPIEGRSAEDLLDLVYSEIVKPTVVNTWLLWDSLFKTGQVQAEHAEKYPTAYLYLKPWVTTSFIISPQSSNALVAGIRTAILGSLWIIAITGLFAFPIGVGAAVYLEEYAQDNTLNRFIETNINNLAGVPSIIYGMLGLTVFVRALAPFTSGSIFGFTDPASANGRTTLSAGLTLALLILPVVIINAQEAIRAVPNSLREASYGLGATKWQTTWYHVLPNAMAGILTGTILSISRAFGETAPLVVIGASTYITFDPNNIFSKFTTLPIQIYQWSVRPQAEFRNLAAAAIIALLVLLVTINAIAILLRNRYSRRLI